MSIPHNPNFSGKETEKNCQLDLTEQFLRALYKGTVLVLEIFLCCGLRPHDDICRRRKGHVSLGSWCFQNKPGGSPFSCK